MFKYSSTWLRVGSFDGRPCFYIELANCCTPVEESQCQQTHILRRIEPE